MIQMPRHGTLPLRVRLLKEHWRWTELAAKRGEWRKIIQRTDGGSGRRSRLRRMPQRVGRGGEQLREIVSRERHKRAVAATRRCHRLLQEIVAAAMPVTHALPLVMRHGSRRISSKEDTGTNPSIILHITRSIKPILQPWRFVSVFQ